MGCGAEQLSLSIALLDDTIRSSPKSQWDCRCETKRYRAVAEESELQLKRFTRRLSALGPGQRALASIGLPTKAIELLPG